MNDGETRRVVVAFDDTSSGADALALGEIFSEVLAARPILATVVRFPRYLKSVADLDEVLESGAGDRLRAAASQFSAFDPELRGLLGESPGKALNELIEKEKPLLTVVGPTHRGPVGHLLAGTTAAALLQGAPCAVAAAPAGYSEQPLRRLLRIGVALDFGDEADWALHAGGSLAARVHASLTLLTVAPPIGFGYGAAYAALSAGTYAEAVEREAESVLERAARQVPDSMPFERRRLTGPVASTLAEATDNLDLLVMGSRGYGPLRRVLLGGVSAPVIERSRCPVLVIPRGAGANPLHFPEHEGAADISELPAGEESAPSSLS